MKVRISTASISFSQDVQKMIKDTIGSAIVEAGGILGRDSETINYFYYDSGTASLRNEYIPDIDNLNEKLKEWHERNISFAGVIHSHCMKEQLSYVDIEYAKLFMKVNKTDSLLMHLFVKSTGSIITYQVDRILDCSDR